jgi:ABC-type dipeptide/oligopeptide/nickel transport system permease component
MTRYIIRRLIQAVPTIILVTVMVFLMLHLTPGDPAEVFLGDQHSTPEMLENVRETMGLNRPLHIQYLDYMWRALQGDLGRSLQNNIPVATQIMLRLPWTVELAISALCLTMVLGIGLGLVAALRHNTIIDTVAMTVAMLGISMPVYWTSILLIILFAVHLQVLPAIGQGGIERLIMPAFALALVSAGSLARMVRSGMLEVLNQDYVLTARSKGLRVHVVVGRHALRNALIPVVTIIGLTFGNLLGGAVITETIFARLGIGQMYVEGVLQKDFTLVQGTTLFIAMSYVLINILTDILYVVIDPRIRYE